MIFQQTKISGKNDDKARNLQTKRGGNFRNSLDDGEKNNTHYAQLCSST
jgi:hypothetical protein